MLGEVIRGLMDERELDQKTLAERADVTPATISYILRGEVTNPKIETLSGIARALGTTTDHLLSGRPPDRGKEAS